VPTGIAAAIAIAAASTVIIGRGTTDAAAVRGVTAPAAGVVPRSGGTTTRPAPGSVTSAGGGIVSATPSVTALAAAQQWMDSVRDANPIDMEAALAQSEAEVARSARAREAARIRAALARDSLVRAARDTVQRSEPEAEVPRLNSLGIPDSL
jgi:hypothetical protein